MATKSVRDFTHPNSMRAGFEPAYTMYSTPAFAIISKGRQEIVETVHFQ
jgi:hypothetical protein